MPIIYFTGYLLIVYFVFGKFYNQLSIIIIYRVSGDIKMDTSAPDHDFNRTFECIYYPAKVENVEKAIQTLGGKNHLSEVSTEGTINYLITT